ncbi:MAG: gamma-glutamylcyclotransferase [Micrococcales bacterium]|nr:MAG: gamma-glutamylcyclotransferase [Micrococcales bacterium]
MVLYAAYRTDLDPAQMLTRAPHSPLESTGWLRGWRLTFGGADSSADGAQPTVVEDPKGSVYVALYSLTDTDTARLDAQEGVDIGRYRRLSVLVETMQGRTPAWVYALEDYEGGLPPAHLVGALADAAEAAGAPADYVQALRLRPCVCG